IEGIDVNAVTEIIFVVTGPGVKKLNVDWGEWVFIPTVGPNLNKTPETMSSLPDSPQNAIVKPAGNNSTITNSQSSRGFLLDYNTTPGGFVGGGFAYDDFGTGQVESFDLSAVQSFDFGIKGSPAQVKMEISDALGNKAAVKLTGITPNEQVWTVDANLFEGIDFTQVTLILFVVEGAGQQGALEVNRKPAAPVIIIPGPIGPSPDVSPNDVTEFDEPPTTEAESFIKRISSELTELHYDLSGSEVHSRLTIRFDDLETPFVIESTDLSAVGQLVFGVSATGASQVQVEIIDAVGARSVETLIQITDQEQFYVINLSNLHSPIDLTHIQAIRFVVSKGFLTNPIGVLTVRAKGVDTTPPALTSALEAQRRQIIAEQLNYFQVGVGVDPDTHLPFDQIENGITRRFTTLTDIGFYLQILGEVVRGSLDNGMTRDLALQEILTVLARLSTMQANDGMGGLLPTIYDMPPTLPVFGPSNTSPFITFGDNANLSQSIAVLIGTLESLDTLSPAQEQLATNVIAAGDTFLDNQETGYDQFYSADTLIDINNNQILTKRFYAAYNTDTNQFESTRIDRLANEFRSGVAFVITRYGFSPQGWNSLIQATKVYQDQFDQNVNNLVPFDGGVFQMFWPLLWSDEQDRQTMAAVLQNFLYTAADFSNRNGIPGFVSASSVPEGGYQGKIGIPGAAETAEAIMSNVGSVYSLASAYILNPALVVTWLKAIFEQYPELISTSRGFVDALRSGTEFSDVFNAIDQGSTILGLLGSGGNFMERYLQNRNLANPYQALYNGLNLGIQPIGLDPIGPPTEFPIRSFSVINNLEADGPLGDNSLCVNPNCVDTTVFGTPIRYNGLTNSTLAGHFWKLNQTYDARNNQFVLSASGTTIPKDLTIEFKDPSDQLIVALSAAQLDQLLVSIEEQTNDNFGTVAFDLSSLSIPGLANVRFVNWVINPTLGGPDADFFVRQITFRQFPSQVLPIFTAAIPTGPDQTQLLNFNVLQLQASGRLAFASLQVQNGNFSTADLVFGFKSNKALKKIKVEIETAAGEKVSGYVTNIGPQAHYYELLKDLVPANVDLSQVQKINIVIDSSSLEEGTTFDDLVVEMSLV
ncbi:MAG: hypothetical protein A3A81_01945, partial [Omnitrophica bacterium RIFCSPLOWO2_01_FULL_45_10b]